MTEDYTPPTYGDRIAGAYDDRYEDLFAEDTARAVTFLRELVGEGPALELGIGTGRIAIPLSEAGVEVHGIDASESMLAVLRAKTGGDRLATTLGDFAGFSLQTTFELVYVVFSTFFVLLTQEEQLSSFRAVSAHLSEGGAFVMQAFVPDASRFETDGQRVSVEWLEVDELSLEASTHDPFAQRVETGHVVIRDGSVRMYPVRIRYAYPSELDLMARLAGLRLRERWSGWGREPYPSQNWTHVSVWEKENADQGP
ncbi:MAG TPA: class I SAM-dependent methyltransferase [Actinomycetota bacterium]|nr:class I SAM-dependent methyltransferase [Actinomycetota bacterium]